MHLKHLLSSLLHIAQSNQDAAEFISGTGDTGGLLPSSDLGGTGDEFAEDDAAMGPEDLTTLGDVVTQVEGNITGGLSNAITGVITKTTTWAQSLPAPPQLTAITPCA